MFKTPSSMTTAKGFKLTGVLASFWETRFAVVYGKVITLDVPPVLV
jgi:hypothetical protein